MRSTNSTNTLLRSLIAKCTKQKSPIWTRVAKDLSRPRRIRREVSLLRINKYSKDGDKIIVPGKVLATGELNHKVEVYALEYSQDARDKISKTGSAQVLEDAFGKKGLKLIG
ncbi:50S ribosomal protein L18e [archaeon]|nr:50S ribosomal protein L18e [archaeon]|tara:strand:- start:1083 stop:1418 length:336 start_codon:yes stop_codon:yes gene_type:complete